MKPTKDPRWNKEYVEQRLRDRRVTAEMKRIADQPVVVDNDADYWFGEYLDQKNLVTELETENAKLKVVLKALLSAIPTSRTVSVTEVWR